MVLEGWKKVKPSKVELERMFKKRRRGAKVWNREKFEQMTMEKKVYSWTVDQFIDEFSLRKEFEDDEEKLKSIRRFLRKVAKDSFEISDDIILLYR